MLLDFNQILEFRKEIVDTGDSFFGGSTTSYIKDVLNGGSTLYSVFANFENKNFAGFLILLNTGDEAEIIQIAVKKDFCKEGRGSEMVRECLEFCRHNGVFRIFLEVRISNEKALRMYEKAGFERTGVRKSYYTAPVEDALIMSRNCCGGCF